MKKLFLVVLTCALAGCAATGQRFSSVERASAAEVRLYVYRPSTFAGAGTFPTVAVDGKVLGDLKIGGYLTLATPPGEVNVRLSGGVLQWPYRERTYKLVVNGGKNYYLRLKTMLSGDGFTNTHSYELVPVREDVAQSELQGLNESK